MNRRTSQVYRISDETPICAACNKVITDSVLAAMGKTWHVDHFTCAHCRKPIKESVFHVENDKPYCEADFLALFAKKCHACGQLIRNSILTALDHPWHRECFKCTKCNKPLALKEFTEKNGNPYCKTCKA